LSAYYFGSTAFEMSILSNVLRFDQGSSYFSGYQFSTGSGLGIYTLATGFTGFNNTAPTWLLSGHLNNWGVDSNGLEHVSATIPITIYSAGGTPLPACGSSLNGQTQKVSDATAPLYMTAYTSGGSTTAEVICSFNGSTYTWLTH
jgi:hypothetical protein